MDLRKMTIDLGRSDFVSGDLRHVQGYAHDRSEQGDQYDGNLVFDQIGTSTGMDEGDEP